ncbi:OPA3-like protein [Metarhizium anisopliae]|nr:OPA3-like protein [Metarhizium anisopliae]
MVPLPLFKLASLFVRHISKYGANQIKAQAHDHPRFRAFAAKYGQHMHQLNMRMSVALLRDPEAERRAKERAEAPTVKTEEQHKRDEAAKSKSSPGASSSSSSSSSSSQSAKYPRFTLQNVWKRKFRPLPEGKAVDLFADAIGDAFILGVAGGLIIYESWKALQKPDVNKQRIDDLSERVEALRRREEELADAEETQRQRFESLEEALRALKDPKTKEPLLPTLQP